MKSIFKIGLPCFFGALIGTMIALSLGKYLWWIGAISGSLVGWILYNPTELYKAIPKAASLAFVETRKTLKMLFTRETGRWMLWGLWGLASITNLILTLFSLPLLILLVTWMASLMWWGTPSYINYVVSSFVVTLSTTYNFIVCVKFLSIKGRYPDNPTAWQFIRVYNPASILIVCGRYVIIFSKEFGTFFQKLFIEVHSQARSICFIDTGVGVTIGYFYGNAFVGAFVGALSGLLNYWIVSIKILKLKPKW